jgi:hypothetical protein
VPCSDGLATGGWHSRLYTYRTNTRCELTATLRDRKTR